MFIKTQRTQNKKKKIVIHIGIEDELGNVGKDASNEEVARQKSEFIVKCHHCESHYEMTKYIIVMW